MAKRPAARAAATTSRVAAGGDGERLLHQDCLAGGQRGQRQRAMMRMRGRQVDHVHVRVAEQRPVRAVRRRDPPVARRGGVPGANAAARSAEREPTAVSTAFGTWIRSRITLSATGPGPATPHRTVTMLGGKRMP
jgi:hypothetical protein